MTHLRKMMLEELERRNYSDRTKECYINPVEDFARYFNKTYCFTLIASLAPVVALPALVTRILWFSKKCRWPECLNTIFILLALIAGFTTGFAVGLSLHPSNWWTVDYSGVDPDAYKNAVEHAREMTFLFLLFCGHTGAMLALASGRFIQRRLQRRTMTPNDKDVRTGDSGTIRIEMNQTIDSVKSSTSLISTVKVQKQKTSLRHFVKAARRFAPAVGAN